MNKAILRRMQICDIPSVAIMVPEDEHSWHADSIYKSLQAGHHCWVLDNNSIILGFAIVASVMDEAEILYIAIAPSAHRKGWGRQLLLMLLQHLKLQQVINVFLEVRASNIGAQMLYTQCGFVEVGQRKDYYPTDGGRENAIVFSYSMRACGD